MIIPDELSFDVAAPDFARERALHGLNESGAVRLRNVFPADAFDRFNAAVHSFLEKPAIAGSFGYYKKDQNKKFVDPFLIGGDAVDICLFEWLIDLVESYMKSECVLSEAFVKHDSPSNYVYFQTHADYTEGARRRSETDIAATAEAMTTPLGVGAVVYLADSSEGAFCFCLGSHKLMSPHGQDLADYPLADQEAILETHCRFDGRRGDIVLFDDRGFHGPDQPSRAERLVMLLDWMRIESWGKPLQAAPIAVFTDDLGRMSEKQLRVLGIGATPLGQRATYHMHTFGRRGTGQFAYRVAEAIVNNAHLVPHLTKTIRARVDRILGKRSVLK